MATTEQYETARKEHLKRDYEGILARMTAAHSLSLAEYAASLETKSLDGLLESYAHTLASLATEIRFAAHSEAKRNAKDLFPSYEEWRENIEVRKYRLNHDYIADL